MKAYDTAEGIRESIKSYPAFLKLLHERHDAYYKRKEKLSEYIVLGKIYLDSCGNVATIDQPSDPTWASHNQHRVMTPKDAFTQMKLYFGHDQRLISNYHMIPTEWVRCPCCNSIWNLDNCTDFVTEQTFESFHLDQYIGRTFTEVYNAIKVRTDAIYAIVDYIIQNDRYIDRSLTDLKVLTSYKNQDGRLRCIFIGGDNKPHGDIDPDTYIITAGDVGTFSKITFKHKACNQHQLDVEFLNQLKSACVSARLFVSGFAPTRNEYGSGSYRGCWYIADTAIGQLKIGWRKRVIELNWEATGQSFLYLFDDIKNTKTHILIHCDTYDQLADVLARMVATPKPITKNPAAEIMAKA